LPLNLSGVEDSETIRRAAAVRAVVDRL